MSPTSVASPRFAADLSDDVVGTPLFVDGGMTHHPGFATGG